MLVRKFATSGKLNSFKAPASKLLRKTLTCVSVKSREVGQHCTMMTSDCCNQKAESCLARAVECSNTDTKAQWLEMAGQWHALAGDESAQATTARLMEDARAGA
jgi:hypothetical protein